MNAPFPIAEDDTVDLGDLTGSVGFMLRMAQITVYEQFFATFGTLGVKPGEFSVLWLINLNPGLRQGALARTLHIKPAHMTKLVQRLVSQDLVERIVPPEDRRSVLLALTDTGRQHVARHAPDFLRVHDAERVGLTEAETRTLLALLQKLAFKG